MELEGDTGTDLIPEGPGWRQRFDGTASSCGSFRKLELPYFGVLIIRILLFRVLY